MRANVFIREHTTKKGETRYTLIVREQGRPDRSIQLGPVAKKVAKERRLQILNELINGNYQSEPTVHLYLDEFFEKYFLEWARGARAPKTVQGYRDQAKSVLRRFQGYRLSQISRHDLEQFLSEQKVSGRTKNIKLDTLRLIFRKAVEWNYLKNSPVSEIKRFSQSKKGSRSLTPEELSRLLSGQLSIYQKSIILIMVNTGLRPGELSNLKWEDIDWQTNRLNVVSDKNRVTKNRKSRYVPMNKELKETLLFLRDSLLVIGGNGGVRLLPREPHQRAYVFCHPNGAKIICFKNALKSAFRKHGIVGVSPHGLRKTFCSMLARSKIHPRVAQQLMGHSDINLTMKVYTEVDDGQLREAVDSLPSTNDLIKPHLRLVVGEN